MILDTLNAVGRVVDGAVGIVDSALKLEPPSMNDVLQAVDGGMSIARTAAMLGCDEAVIADTLKEAGRAVPEERDD